MLKPEDLVGKTNVDLRCYSLEGCLSFKVIAQSSHCEMLITEYVDSSCNFHINYFDPKEFEIKGETTSEKELYYRIAWRSKITGYKSHGKWMDTIRNVECWIPQLNRQHPELDHWIEQTKFLVLNSVSRGSGSANFYKPPTVF